MANVNNEGTAALCSGGRHALSTVVTGVRRIRDSDYLIKHRPYHRRRSAVHIGTGG